MGTTWLAADRARSRGGAARTVALLDSAAPGGRVVIVLTVGTPSPPKASKNVRVFRPRADRRRSPICFGHAGRDAGGRPPTGGGSGRPTAGPWPGPDPSPAAGRWERSGFGVGPLGMCGPDPRRFHDPVRRSVRPAHRLRQCAAATDACGDCIITFLCGPARSPSWWTGRPAMRLSTTPAWRRPAPHPLHWLRPWHGGHRALGSWRPRAWRRASTWLRSDGRTLHRGPPDPRGAPRRGLNRTMRFTYRNPERSTDPERTSPAPGHHRWHDPPTTVTRRRAG